MTTDEREMLEAIARAMSLKGEWWEDESGLIGQKGVMYEDETGCRCIFNSFLDDGDCARMCAELTLKTEYLFFVVVVANESKILTRTEQYKNHNNRLAAWRYACCRVAAEIGRWTT